MSAAYSFLDAKTAIYNLHMCRGHHDTCRQVSRCRSWHQLSQFLTWDAPRELVDAVQSGGTSDPKVERALERAERIKAALGV